MDEIGNLLFGVGLRWPFGLFLVVFVQNRTTCVVFSGYRNQSVYFLPINYNRLRLYISPKRIFLARISFREQKHLR